MTPLGHSAVALAAKGLRVFPCKERGKEPAIADNLRRATTDANLISGWWSAHNFNIGLATGEGSGVWVLDVDGDEGEVTLRRLESEHGPLGRTVEAITGKGRHLYFRWPSGVAIRNKQVNPNMPGIDVRGNGGYVLCPPSIHPSGRVYAWSVDSGSDFEDAPDWLLALITRAGPRLVHTSRTEQEWRSFLNEPVEGSRRGAAVASFFGFLLRKNLPVVVSLDMVCLYNEARCRPPLNDEEIKNITHEILRRDTERLKEPIPEEWR